jgi:hypothetical protein
MDSRLDNGQTLQQMFAGLVEQVFESDLGLCSPRLTDYVSGLLAEFVHVDRIYRLRNVDGDVIREVSRMEAEGLLGGEVSSSARRYMINRYIGDFTLFWTGVYPESLRPRLAGVDRLHEFLLQGRRSYGIASELAPPDAQPDPALLRELSHEFEACVHGLQRVRSCFGAADRRLSA